MAGRGEMEFSIDDWRAWGLLSRTHPHPLPGVV